MYELIVTACYHHADCRGQIELMYLFPKPGPDNAVLVSERHTNTGTLVLCTDG